MRQVIAIEGRFQHGWLLAITESEAMVSMALMKISRIRGLCDLLSSLNTIITERRPARVTPPYRDGCYEDRCG
jgi:hypothetical protein